MAPATANTIGKLANGIADDFLTSLYLATRAPVLIAPAMNTNMLEHAAVQRNLQTLASRGVRFVDPGEGFLACGWIGKGRLAEPEAIVEAAEGMLKPSGSLLGKPCRRVRRSHLRRYRSRPLHRQPLERPHGIRDCGRSGAPRRRMLSWSAGPTSSTRRPVCSVERVRSAPRCTPRDARSTRQARTPWSWRRPSRTTCPQAGPHAAKIEKTDAPITLTLVRTPDILADLGRSRGGASRTPVLVGFAAETGDPRRPRRARSSLPSSVDLIVANDVSRDDAGFDAETNAAYAHFGRRREPRCRCS